MPMFNWQADSGTAVVSPRFWVYWAITAPLTILVVLVWFIWIAFKDARHKREDLEMAQGFEVDGKEKEKGGEEGSAEGESAGRSSGSSSTSDAHSRRTQTNDADIQNCNEPTQHSGSKRPSRLSEHLRPTHVSQPPVPLEPTPVPPSSGRKPWRVSKDLGSFVRSSKAALGLRTPQEKQNLA